MADDTPNIQGLVTDPRFQGLPPEHQRATLAAFTNDKRFQSMSDVDTKRFLAGYSAPATTGIGSLPPPPGGDVSITARPDNPIRNWLSDAQSDITGGTASTIIGKILGHGGSRPGGYDASGRYQPGAQTGTAPTGTGAAAQLLAGPALGPLAAAHGVANMPEHPVQGANELMRGVGQTLGLPLAVASPAALAVGVPSMVAQHATQKGLTALGVDPDYAELAGNIVGLRTGTKLVKGIAPGPGMAIPKAAEKLTDAVIPKKEQMAKFQSNVEDTLLDARNAAKRNGYDITDRPSMARAYRGGADDLKAIYDDKMLAPVKGKLPVKDIPGYEGAQLDANSASAAQLNKRLTDINGELYQSYEKGGQAAQAAVKTKAQLTAEARGIRAVLDPAISDATGYDVATIADTRSRFGKMYDVADKVETSINRGRVTENLKAQGEKMPTSLQEGGISTATRLKRTVFGHPADRAVNQVMQGIRPGGESIPPTPRAPGVTPTLRAPFQPPPDTPNPALQRLQSGNPNVRVSSAADIAENTARMGANRMARAQQTQLDLQPPPRVPIWQQGGAAPDVSGGTNVQGSSAADIAQNEARIAANQAARAARRKPSGGTPPAPQPPPGGGLPPISGGSQATEGAMGSRAIAEHNAAFNQAKAEWMAKNPNADPIRGLSAIAKRAEELRRSKH
jgi:hypothetical protein